MEKVFSAEDLDQTLKVTQPTGWLALLIIAVLILATLVWSLTGSLSVKVGAAGILLEDTDGRQKAAIFLPLSEQTEVSPGMPVQITPAGFSPQEYGYLLGIVSSVSRYPLSLQNLTTLLKNDALAAIFCQSGPQYLATIELQNDDGHKNYTWTSGQTLPVSTGTLLQANIIVSEKKPIALLMPGGN